MALRLTGRSPRGPLSFDGILEEALAVLLGQRAVDGADANEARDLALRGATHLLVDEYQDLDARQVRLLEAIAGRTHPEPNQRLAIFAVGDDDQSIFGWRGGSARWVREFGEAWSAEQFTLTTCYRCARPILAAASRVVEPVQDRLKAGVQLDSQRDGHPVRRWMARPEQVGPTVAALLGSVPGDVAILARTRATLAPIRAALEAAGVPVEWPLTHDERIAVSRVREVVRVLDKLEECDGVVLDNAAIAAMIGHGGGPWFALLERWRQDVFLSHGESGTLGGTAQRALWELLATEREERTLGEGVRLGTLHGAKGLEWRHVILVDGGDGASDDDERRLWYVGMTRAAERLDLVVRHDRPHPLLRAIGVEQVPASGDVAPTRVHYELLGLDAIWIDGLGRDAEAPGHAVLDHLEFGAEVSLEVRGPRLVLVAQGAVIAWLTDRAAGIWRDRGAVLRFVAAIRRDAEQTEPTWRAHLGRDTWWVPICEGMWREGSSSSERSSIMASPGNVQVIWAIRQAR